MPFILIKAPYPQSLDMSDTNVSHILTKITAKDRKRERDGQLMFYMKAWGWGVPIIFPDLSMFSWLVLTAHASPT